MNIKNTDNSFFQEQYNNIKVLVLVPHEDDEINTAANAILNFVHGGAEVYIAYLTNGDWKYPAEIRFKEAFRVAKILGIDKDHLFFMGYGDSINNGDKNHIFYIEEGYTSSPAGFHETYGAIGINDYAFAARGKHSLYSSKNYVDDLVSLIQELNADLIICTDFDEHPDHRMLALCFDKAMGQILRNNPDYHPEVWKRFAYCLAYTAIPDFFTVNLPETKRPQLGLNEKYAWDIIDTSIYNWEKRFRIPVVEAARNQKIRKNIIGKALLKHKSQYIILRADRIINSDEVYWRRRTDSISYTAQVSVISGNAEYLSDFMLFNVSNIDEIAPSYCNYLWTPDKDDDSRAIIFTWDSDHDVSLICLYGEMTEGSQITRLKVELDNGYIVETGALPLNGEPLRIAFEKQHNIRECKISILETTGADCGIAECEIYEEFFAASVIKPFVKILVNDNFAYNYVIDKSQKELRLGLYQYNIDETFSLNVVKGKSIIKRNVVYIDSSDKKIVISAKGESETNEFGDLICIERVSKLGLVLKKASFIPSRCYLKYLYLVHKCRNVRDIFLAQGLKGVFSRVFSRLVKK